MWRPDRIGKSNYSYKNKLTPKTQLFLTLARIRVGLLLQDIGFRLSVSVTYVSRVVITWIMFMFDRFKLLEIFPKRETRASKKPKAFRKFKNLRVVIDCFEIRTQSATDYREKGNTYSSYKSSATLKFLCGMHTSGGVCFLSEGFEGATSDRQIFKDCGIMDHLDVADVVMADRGFDVKDLLNEIGCQLIIPPFLKGRKKFTKMEVRSTRSIAAARVHVERTIGRMKNYRILQKVIPKTMVSIVSQTTFVIAMLVNFQENIVK